MKPGHYVTSREFINTVSQIQETKFKKELNGA